MPDKATTCQVTRIEIGPEYMNILLAGKPLTLAFPNPENPTHQFAITIDEPTRKILTNGVTRIEPARKGQKKTPPQSTRPKKSR